MLDLSPVGCVAHSDKQCLTWPLLHVDIALNRSMNSEHKLNIGIWSHVMPTHSMIAQCLAMYINNFTIKSLKSNAVYTGLYKHD